MGKKLVVYVAVLFLLSAPCLVACGSERSAEAPSEDHGQRDPGVAEVRFDTSNVEGRTQFRPSTQTILISMHS